jgi:Flp pilus assembly pilin Flp
MMNKLSNVGMKLGMKWNARAARLMKSEEGLGTVEIILIIAVLVAVVLIFKEQLSNLVTNLFSSADTETQRVFTP